MWQIDRTWTGVKWFIEADVKDCFGSLDHGVLMSVMAEDIHDARFMELVRRMLKAGYLEDWEYHPTYSGAPQGGVLSPLLSNIYLDRLDRSVEDTLIPRHTRGARRRHNPVWHRLAGLETRARRRGDQDARQRFREQRERVPSSDQADPGHRRLRYSRYADDHLLGFAGPRKEAEQIKQELGEFLARDLKLTLSESKTLITHASTGKARRLGYDFATHTRRSSMGRPHLAGNIRLLVPGEVVRQQAKPYLRAGKPVSLPQLVQADDYTVVAYYGAKYRGV
ncbi:MAG: reverse transcriptase/maturase family protein, partial [Propionibacteriaceae bacterium]|nr:reverse transcriptase/maturase family protein [Propionibacteriaceae bacterium]